MRRSFLGLLSKSFVFFVTPVLILAILGYVSVFMSARYAREQMAQLAGTTLRQIERASQQLIGEARATAIAFGTAEPVLQALRVRLDDGRSQLEGLRELELIRNLIATSAHAREHIRSIYVYVEGFDDVLTTDSGIISVDALPDDSWLAAYRAQDADVSTWAARRDSTLLSSATAPEPVISVYQRFFTLTSHSLEGVVVLNVREDALLDVITEAAFSREQRFVVLDSAGSVVVSSVTDRAVLAEIREVPTGLTAPVRVAGQRFMATSASTLQTDWRYVMLTPESVYFAPVNGMVRISLAIVTAAVVLGLLIVGIMARRSYGFIREVLDVIERSESGEALPSTTGHSTSGFGYVTYHVLRAFVERQYYQLQLSERAYREKTLELLALQSQMNPHFLFNTLEAVNWQILSETGAPGPASEMIDSLAQIMKYALRPPTRLVRLEAELENVENYVRIQSLRKQSTYELELDVDPALVHTAMIPMTLQPLVENAIVHGFRDRDRGRIVVHARRSAEGFSLRVEDDGLGVPLRSLERLREELQTGGGQDGEQIGLVHTAQRLRLVFESDVSVRLGRSSMGGFRVDIGLPLQTLPEDTPAGARSG